MQVNLELRNVTKTFPGVIALEDVSVDFVQGEIHALVGENGAGKSTLIKILTGVNTPDCGEIIYEGKSYKGLTTSSARELGIGVIYQELTLVNQLTVAENIFLGNLPKKAGVALDRKEMIRRTREIFEEMGMAIEVNAKIQDLTVGFQQMVVLAKAVLEESKVLVMDEPTAPLSNYEVKILFKQIEKLQKRGITIIYISHRLDEVFRLADRITILRDGQKVRTMKKEEADSDSLISMMVGRTVKEIYPKRNSKQAKEIILETKNLTGNGDSDVSLQVKKGEILGLGGLVGAGRTEFAQLLYGVKKIENGEIHFKGKRVQIQSPRHAMKLGISLVPEDRKRQGLILGKSIKQNISISVLKKLSRGIVLNHKKEEELAIYYNDKMHTKASGLEQKVKNLSGGNQQKVVVSKGLATKPELIIIDEPTRGIDVGAKQEIYLLMNELISEGMTIIMITSEMDELLGMSDRIAVFCEGRMTGLLERGEFSAESILQYASQTKEQEELQ